MKLAFKIASGPGTNATDRLIAAHDAGPYSHVELVFDRLFPTPPNGPKLSFSARYGEGWFPRFIYYPPERWDLIEVPCSIEKESELCQWAIAIQGVRYDTPGVSALAGLMPHEQSEAFFCSEGCLYGLQTLNLFADAVASKTTPNALAKLARSAFSEAVAARDAGGNAPPPMTT
jgi:hypothetical protein